VTPLLVIRHGVTDWNAQNRLQGQSDRPLSAEGEAQVRSWIIPKRFNHFRCVTSPLIRAKETAQGLGLSFEEEPALTEMSWGDWEGENWQDLQATLGRPVMAAHEAKGIDFRPDGGESPRNVIARLTPWLADLAVPTLAIGHKGVLQALYSMASEWDMTEKAPIKFRHGEAYLFEVADGKPLLTEMNIPLENK
jgi:broad specificity phosphatase PhoE